MDEKKVLKMDDKALQNVAGGQADAKYAIGEEVVFVATLFGRTGMNGRVKKKGTIIAINGKTYSIRSGIVTYTVKEEDIRTPPATVPTENSAHANENGADGGW